MHNGRTYGRQSLIDPRRGINVTTSFVQSPLTRDRFYTSVRIEALPNTPKGRSVGFAWYWATEDEADDVHVTDAVTGSVTDISSGRHGIPGDKPCTRTFSMWTR